MKKLISFIFCSCVLSLSAFASVEELENQRLSGRFVEGEIDLNHPDIIGACSKMHGSFVQNHHYGPLVESIRRGGCTWKIVGLFSSYNGLGPKWIPVVAEGFHRYAPARNYGVNPSAFFLSKLFARTFFGGLKEKKGKMGAAPLHDYRQNTTIIRRLVQQGSPEALTCETGGDLLCSYQREFPRVLGDKLLTPENLLDYERREHIKNFSKNLRSNSMIIKLRQGIIQDERKRATERRIREEERERLKQERLESSFMRNLEAHVEEPMENLHFEREDIRRQTESIFGDFQKAFLKDISYTEDMRVEKVNSLRLEREHLEAERNRLEQERLEERARADLAKERRVAEQREYADALRAKKKLMESLSESAVPHHERPSFPLEEFSDRDRSEEKANSWKLRQKRLQEKRERLERLRQLEEDEQKRAAEEAKRLRQQRHQEELARLEWEMKEQERLAEQKEQLRIKKEKEQNIRIAQLEHTIQVIETFIPSSPGSSVPPPLGEEEEMFMGNQNPVGEFEQEAGVKVNDNDTYPENLGFVERENSSHISFSNTNMTEFQEPLGSRDQEDNSTRVDNALNAEDVLGSFDESSEGSDSSSISIEKPSLWGVFKTSMPASVKNFFGWETQVNDPIGFRNWYSNVNSNFSNGLQD
ncbi:MAG: hypothetical protein GY915_00455 [bacterium]|nr:hypothetical protein [bacterium]